MGQALLLIGGTIVASSDKTDAIFGESITINGGNITADGNGGGAGIGGGNHSDSGKIIINGTETNTITNQMMGGGMKGEMPGQMKQNENMLYGYL